MQNRRAVGAAIALALVTGLLLPILFGEPPTVNDRSGGDPWRLWILDFQTLISGLAAVGAAAGTILVMVETDQRQERRHQQLVRLALRPDRLRIERMTYPAVAMLTDDAIMLREVQARIERVVNDRLDLHLELFKLETFLKDFNRAITMHTFAEGRGLFSASAEFFYGKMLRDLERALLAAERLRKGVSVYGDDNKPIDNFEALRGDLIELMSSLIAFYDAFRKMAEEYDIELSKFDIG